MSLDMPSSVRVSQQARDQLVKLKRVTGLKQWNVLCRWALTTSLADPTPPLVRDIRADSNVEMTWRTYAGPCETAFEVLLVDRFCNSDEKFGSITDLLTAHLHRGIGQLAGSIQLKGSISDLVEPALS